MKKGADDEFVESIRQACMTAVGWGVPEEEVLRTMIFMASWVIVENELGDADNQREMVEEITDNLIASLHQQVQEQPRFRKDE